MHTQKLTVIFHELLIHDSKQLNRKSLWSKSTVRDILTDHAEMKANEH